MRVQGYKDFNNVSKGRIFLNQELLPKWAFRCPNGADVLFIGVHRYWDYQSFWNNPAKLCNFYTMDIHPGNEEQPKPDYCLNIETCDELENNRFQQIIMIGVFEYLDNPELAFKQIHRMLKIGGVAIFAFTGKAEYNDNRGMASEEVFARLAPLQVIEMYLTYERDNIPNSVMVVATKI